MPQLVMLAGPNGAGKTTTAKRVLPGLLGEVEFVNADEIARGLSPFQPDKHAIAAGKLMLQRIEMLLANNKDFAIETTLSGNTYLDLIQRAQAVGYTVTMLYVYLESPELARNRVDHRVAAGGHNIPTDVIKRRYVRSIQNLINDYITLLDKWFVYDNSHPDPSVMPDLIAYGVRGDPTIIVNLETWQCIKQKASIKA